jgi:predicted amidophosphoribosyltransferase
VTGDLRVPPGPYVSGMICLGCRRLDPGPLCPRCCNDLRPAPDRLLDDNLLVRSAFLHEGPARALVHNLKYRGIGDAGRILAEAMAPLVPPQAVLTPLVRVRWREFSYGIDPARELARLLSEHTGARVADLLAAPWLAPARARVSSERPSPPMFRLRRPPECPVVLIDDVVTTGRTIEQARRLIGRAVTLALTATSSAR